MQAVSLDYKYLKWQSFCHFTLSNISIETLACTNITHFLPDFSIFISFLSTFCF